MDTLLRLEGRMAETEVFLLSPVVMLVLLRAGEVPVAPEVAARGCFLLLRSPSLIA